MKESIWHGGKFGLLDVELDGTPLNNCNEIDATIIIYPKESQIKVLGSAYAFKSGKIKRKDQTTYGGGIVKVGIITEFKPFKNGGTVISVGTIGFCNAIQKGDPAAHKVFLNTIRYLQSLH